MALKKGQNSLSTVNKSQLWKLRLSAAGGSWAYNTHWQVLRSALPICNTSQVTGDYTPVQNFWLLLALKTRHSQCSHSIQNTDITYPDRWKAAVNLSWGKNTLTSSGFRLQWVLVTAAGGLARYSAPVCGEEGEGKRLHSTALKQPR